MSEDVRKQYEDLLLKKDTMCIDAQNVLEIIPSLVQLQDDKGQIYGRSWCKHGELSAFFNLERKWDRISNIMEKAMKDGVDNTIYSKDGETATETFLDTVVDLSVYSLMLVGYIKENHPEEWERFLENNNLND